MAATKEIRMPREVHSYDLTESFSVTNGVKQGCVLPPRSSPSSSQQCLTMLSVTYEMAPIHSRDRALTYSTSHTSERRPKLLRY